MDAALPELILTLNDPSFFIAALKASSTSPTYTKSLVCSPSPNIVTGFCDNILFKNIDTTPASPK